MAKARVQVKLDSDNIRALLKGPEVGKFLGDLGNKVASNAGPDYLVDIDYTSRKTRVVVNVYDPAPDARFKEASSGRLARALGGVQ